MAKINVFISYQSPDKDLAVELKQVLNKIGWINGIVVEDNPNVGRISDTVIEDLDKSLFICPILTKKSIAGQWVNQEIGYAIAKKLVFIPLCHSSLPKNALKGFVHNDTLQVRFKKTNFDIACKKIVKKIKNEIKKKSLSIFFKDHWLNVWKKPKEKKSEAGTQTFKIDGHTYRLLDPKLQSYSDDFKLDKFKISTSNNSLKIHFKKINGTENNDFDLEFMSPIHFRGTEQRNDANQTDNGLMEINWYKLG